MKIFKSDIILEKFRNHDSTKRKTVLEIAIVVLLVLGIGLGLLYVCGDFEKPAIALKNESPLLGLQTPVDIALSDYKSGLRDIEINIIQNNKTYILLSAHYPKGIAAKQFSIKIPYRVKLVDGPAIIHVSARDYSFLKRENTLNKEVIIDTTVPQLFLSSADNNINQGGTGAITYSASEALSLTGVQVENIFFRGYPINISGKLYYITYYTLPLDIKDRKVNIKIIAKDAAGNESSNVFSCLVHYKKFRTDKMALSDNFLQQKMPEFQLRYQNLRNKSLIETFAYVNEQMRNDDLKTIQSICQKSEPKQLWQDVFLRMKNAAPMAMFGDRRTYFYKGSSVGESIHMGVDLASTANAPIEASNNGVVSFAGVLGIYGNTVIIDHGLGLFSLYGHLNSIAVKNAQRVKKGEIIGYSGISGLAGGDHLHFSILIGGQFVNPQEWWDAHWIADNVSRKMAITGQ